MRLNLIVLIFLILTGCSSNKKKPSQTYSVHHIGAMKDVMWKGKLHGIINLDTLQNIKGLYGIGPLEYLTGESLLINGRSFRATVNADSSMYVDETFRVKAPFYVYGYVNEWSEEQLPNDVFTLQQLEVYMNHKYGQRTKPFIFKIKGTAEDMDIHIQNLPKGSKVSSPAEAHQVQVNYVLSNKDVEIIGFFSTKHKGIFTHHDSNMHLHAITTDYQKMGHLDDIVLKSGAYLYVSK